MGFGAPLSYKVVGSAVVPGFLGDQDWPWLRGLLDERERFVGRPQRALEARLRAPLPREGPPGKKRLALHVLAGLGRSERDAAVPPRQARRLVFGEAARAPGPRPLVLARVASALNVPPLSLDAALFADLPGERLVAELPHALSPAELALRANLVLAQGLLFRAALVTIEAEGNARTVVRHAKLGGLICTVAERAPGGDVRLDVSGPFAVFRHTRLYGRALGRLVPLLAWCRRFRLRATCVLDGEQLDLQLGTGDPIFPAEEPRLYDSRIEARFAREFRRLAPDWDVLREPEPVAAGSSLVFPDFALQHLHDPSRRWLVEIVGFWTPEYLSRKLALYRAAHLANLILCIDENRACGEGDLPDGALVLRFRRHVDAAAVLRLVERPAVPGTG